MSVVMMLVAVVATVLRMNKRMALAPLDQIAVDRRADAEGEEIALVEIVTDVIEDALLARDITVVIDAYPTALAFLGRNQDDTIGSPGTIDG